MRNKRSLSQEARLDPASPSQRHEAVVTRKFPNQQRLKGPRHPLRNTEISASRNHVLRALNRGQRGRVMGIGRSGSSLFQSNASAKWVEEWEVDEEGASFRQAELARWQFRRIDGTKTRQRRAYGATRGRGHEPGG